MKLVELKYGCKGYPVGCIVSSGYLCIGEYYHNGGLICIALRQYRSVIAFRWPDRLVMYHVGCLIIKITE